MTATRDRELRFDAKMSDAEALMWTIEKDPWLNPSGAMVSVLNQPLNFEAFRIRINCFKNDPSVKSSLKFLRKTDWARNKVEILYKQFIGVKDPERRI